MKKLYALSLAALMAAGTANAANPFGQSVKHAADKSLSTELMTESTRTLQAADFSSLPQKVRTLAEGETTTTDPYVGKYMLTGVINDHFQGAVMEIIADPEEEEGSGYYYIKNFIMEGVNDVPCTIEDREIGTSTYPVLTIKGGGRVPLYTSGTNTFYLRLFDYGEDGNTPSIYRDDIEFVIIDGTLVQYYTNSGIAWVTSEGRGNWIMEPEAYAINGVMACYEFDSSSSQFVPAQYDLFALQSETKLMVFNFAGLPSPIIFDMNLETGAAQAVDQVGYYHSTYGEFVLQPVPDDDETEVENVVEASVSNDDEGGTSTLYVTTPEWWAISDAGWWQCCATTLCQFDFKIEGLAGVEGVQIDENENAPVEYYNLQGVRVTEPANGLYIVRQGSKVSKQIIK